MAHSYLTQLKREYKKEVRAELKIMFQKKVKKAVALGVRKAMEKQDRRKKFVDWDSVCKCFEAQLTVEQTASIQGMSVAGLYAKFSVDNPGEKLGDLKAKHRQLGKACLMQELMKRALESENFAPLKFALQNHLGMTDKTRVETTFDLAGEMNAAEQLMYGGEAEVIECNPQELSCTQDIEKE